MSATERRANFGGSSLRTPELVTSATTPRTLYARTFSSRASSGGVSVTAAFMTPRSRMVWVMRLVSTPQMPRTPLAARKLSTSVSARKLEGSRQNSRTTTALAWMRGLSRSS